MHSSDEAQLGAGQQDSADGERKQRHPGLVEAAKHDTARAALCSVMVGYASLVERGGEEWELIHQRVAVLDDVRVTALNHIVLYCIGVFVRLTPRCIVEIKNCWVS